jgi:hypothetical protein
MRVKKHHFLTEKRPKMSDTRTNLSFFKDKRQNLKDEMGHLPIYWGRLSENSDIAI